MIAKRVILAEDDFLVGKEISRTLKSLGYQVIAEASDGREAVEKTCELKPDVVIMDIQMPRLDGFQASEQIQMHCPTPIVILTAYESQDLVIKAGKAGVGAYLTKPPKSDEIERAIVISTARHADLMCLRDLYREMEEKNKKLEEALSEIQTLRGILPICAGCKKIRDDKGYWNQIELYIEAHSEAEFSHGICPDCMEKLYGHEDWYKKRKA